MGKRTVEHTLPAIHALHLVELAQRWKVRPARLLEGLGLTVERLSDPEARLPIATMSELAERARALTGEDALGFYLGLQMRISSHGYLGFAAMAASTLGEALDLAVRFAPTRTSALGLHLGREGRVAQLAIEEHGDFGRSRDVHLFALMVGIWRIGETLTGRKLPGSADLRFPRPGYFARIAGQFPGAVRFDQPVNQLVFDAALLATPLTMSDPAALRLATAQCERELDAVSEQRRFVTRVKALIAAPSGVPSLEQVADALALSPRTLKRRLALRGASFSELLDAHRRERAVLLLRSSRLPMDEIALKLGYSDAANFTRAFRRWTGMAPGQYRRQADDAPGS